MEENLKTIRQVLEQVNQVILGKEEEIREVMLAFLALFLFVYQAHDTVLFVAALVPEAAALIAYIVVMTLWWRCPHCHKPLPQSPLHGEYVVTHCPYCGGAIDDEEGKDE